MEPLSASDLLDIWDACQGLRHVQIGLMLLASARPDLTLKELEELKVGRRDQLLIQFREQIFGKEAIGIAECPTCGESLEFAFQTNDLLSEEHLEEKTSIDFSIDGYYVLFRLPASIDLMAISDKADVDHARQILIDRCILSCHHDGNETASDQLTAHVLDAVMQRMSEIDPYGDIALSIICPKCNQESQVAFDIVSFLWREIDARASHLIEEVDALASAYGWSEAEILAMSSRRRQRYLNLVG
jgi:uncharacterized protein (UPF0212 family)